MNPIPANHPKSVVQAFQRLPRGPAISWLLATWSLPWAIGALVAGAVVVFLTGPRLAAICETIAARTGLGQAITGSIFLGASTSLSGLVTSITAAAENRPALALSNAVGGIAAQTVFLAIADCFYRRANLEHAAASSANNFMTGLLVALLALVLTGTAAPEWTLGGVHPISLILVFAYVLGMRIAMQAKDNPMWLPNRTEATRDDAPTSAAQKDRRSNARIWTLFACLALALGLSGWMVARAGVSIAEQTGMSDSFVGGVLTAIATSLAELVTAIAAVRRGALALAVGDIVGGNVFDVLFICAADAAYRPGSLYHAAGQREIFVIALGILLSSILLMGLVRREKLGPGRIGLESVLMLILYAAGVATLAFTR